MMTEGKRYKKETEVSLEASVIQFKKMGHVWKDKGHGQKAQMKQ